MPSFPEIMQYVPGLIGAPFRAYEQRQAQEANAERVLSGARRIMAGLPPDAQRHMQNLMAIGDLQGIQEFSAQVQSPMRMAELAGMRADTAGTQASTGRDLAMTPGDVADSTAAGLIAENTPTALDLENQGAQANIQGTNATTQNTLAGVPGTAAESAISGLMAEQMPQTLADESTAAAADAQLKQAQTDKIGAEINAMNAKADETPLSPIDTAERSRRISSYGEFLADKPMLDAKVERFNMVLDALTDGRLRTGQMEGRLAFQSPLRDLLHSISIEIARDKLKAAGESRPTDRDVDLMIESGSKFNRD